MFYFSINVTIIFSARACLELTERFKMKNFSLFITDAKVFLSNELNRVFVAVVILGILMCYGQHRTEEALSKVSSQSTESQKELISEIKKNRDKIHFRYFNLTKSLEEIHKVKIDTKNGKLER